MELDTFVRFHAREGKEEAIAALMREMRAPVRAEPGCVMVDYYRSIRAPLVFHIHSRWRDEAAFEVHAELPHTVRFLREIEPLIDHELREIGRAHV